jgi:hypothetical protein
MDITRIQGSNITRGQVKSNSAGDNANPSNFFAVLNGMLSNKAQSRIMTNSAGVPTSKPDSAVKETSSKTRQEKTADKSAGQTTQASSEPDQAAVSNAMAATASTTPQPDVNPDVAAAAAGENTILPAVIPGADQSVPMTQPDQQAPVPQTDVQTAQMPVPPQTQTQDAQNSQNAQSPQNTLPDAGQRFSAEYAQEIQPDDDSLPYQAPNINTQPLDAADGELKNRIDQAVDELNQKWQIESDSEIVIEKPISNPGRTTELHTMRRQDTATAVVENLNQESRTTTETTTTAVKTDPQSFRSTERTRETRTVNTETEPSTNAALTGARTPDRVQEFQSTRQIGEQPQSGPADQANQIQAEVVRNLENQKMEFRMQLQPEELGQIDIKMALQGGKLMIEIISSARTSELLSRQVDNLVATLKQNAPDLSSVQVVSETRQAPGNMDSAFNMNSFNRGQDQAAGHGGRSGRGSAQESFVEEYGDTTDITPQTNRLLNYEV